QRFFLAERSSSPAGAAATALCRAKQECGPGRRATLWFGPASPTRRYYRAESRTTRTVPNRRRFAALRRYQTSMRTTSGLLSRSLPRADSATDEVDRVDALAHCENRQFACRRRPAIPNHPRQRLSQRAESGTAPDKDPGTPG